MKNNIQAFYSQKVWIDNQLQAATIQIKNGRISNIFKGEKRPTAKDVGNNIIMPGVIDAHVHINEPGRTDWEGFETATKAAARGGTTTLIDMPLNSSPVVTNVSAFEAKLKATKGKLWVNCGFWAGAIDDDTETLKALINKGCLGVKVFLSHSGIDEFPNISLADLDKVMAALKNEKVPILAHCELDTLPAETDLATHPTSYLSYLKSRPKHWENQAIEAFVNLAKKNHCRVHIVHLSSTDKIDWLKQQKQAGVKLTVETCPHYLLFQAEDIEDGNTLYKCAPPIRERANNQQLKQALKTGLIDFITTDHSPAPPHIKELESGNLKKAWGGIAGLQFLLSASWTALENTLSVEKFIPLVTSQPARFLDLDDEIGFIKKGYRADLTIWNPNSEFIVTTALIEHRHKATPYAGKKLKGEVMTTIVNGQVVFDKGRFVQANAGRLVL